MLLLMDKFFFDLPVRNVITTYHSICKIETMVCNFNDKANFPHKLLLTNTQVSRLRKAFANVALANTKFLKSQ